MTYIEADNIHDNLDQTLMDFLSGLFPADKVAAAANHYRLDSFSDRDTIFWQIDVNGNIRTGHRMKYGTDGHRDKNHPTEWMHRTLWKVGRLSSDFQLRQCLFGEHLLNGNDKQVAIVESEKTAVYMSLKQPRFVWLASCGAEGLTDAKMHILKGREVILFPDADKTTRWTQRAMEVKKQGYRIVVDNFAQRNALLPECAKWDIMDYFVAEHQGRNIPKEAEEEKRKQIEALPKEEEQFAEWFRQFERLSSMPCLLTFPQWQTLLGKYDPIRVVEEIRTAEKCLLSAKTETAMFDALDAFCASGQIEISL